MGVWTLPPSLRACRDLAGEAKQSCEEKYRAIGESDRMTLKFRKPAG
jgi:predicted methyltransferase